VEPNVFERLAAHRDDPVLVMRAVELLANYEEEQKTVARRGEFVDEMVFLGTFHQYTPALLALEDRPRLRFDHRVHVPEAYDVLERNGLVCCYFGTEQYDRRERDIVLTVLGQTTIDRIRAKENGLVAMD
jgi:hypothetical protein